jgi:hypothetical protein
VQRNIHQTHGKYLHARPRKVWQKLFALVCSEPYKL